MEPLERSHDDEYTQPPRNSAGSGPTGNLSRLRAAADQFLNAGDNAVSRALSRDSEAFLAANRQHGGQ